MKTVRCAYLQVLPGYGRSSGRSTAHHETAQAALKEVDTLATAFCRRF